MDDGTAARELVESLKTRERAEEKQAFVEKNSARLEKALRELKAEFPGAQLTPEIVFTAVRSYVDVAFLRLEQRIKVVPNRLIARSNEQNRLIEGFHKHFAELEDRLHARIDNLIEDLPGGEQQARLDKQHQTISALSKQIAALVRKQGGGK